MYCDDNSALEFTEGKDLIKPSTPPESATNCACFGRNFKRSKIGIFGFPFPRKVIFFNIFGFNEEIKTFKFWYLNLD